MKSIFDNWKWEIATKIQNCKSMMELHKALKDELYGVEEYLEEQNTD